MPGLRVVVDLGRREHQSDSALGHKTATMTWDRYGHLYPDDLETVADRLDEAAAVPLRSIPLLRLVAGEGKPS